MSFAVDHSQAGEELRPEGEYECVIEKAYQTTTKFGTPLIDIRLPVRKDVQNPRGGVIFHSLWMKKEPTAADNACEGYSAKQIQALSKAAGLPNGKSYDGIDSWCADLAGRPVRVTIAHEEYKGQTTARVKWVNETKFPDVKDAPAPEPELLDDDGDVPF